MDIKNPLLIFWLRIGTLVYSEPASFICPFEAKKSKVDFSLKTKGTQRPGGRLNCQTPNRFKRLQTFEIRRYLADKVKH